MSANINFAASAASASPTSTAAPVTTATTSSSSPPTGEARGKSHMILPYEVLFNLVGRRVTVLLTQKGFELEGTLQSVDSDKGDMLLSEVVQYHWVPTAAPSPADGPAAEAAEKTEEGFLTCFGGGQREEVSRCSQAMVNSAFVAVVTPTLFVPE